MILKLIVVLVVSAMVAGLAAWLVYSLTPVAWPRRRIVSNVVGVLVFILAAVVAWALVPLIYIGGGPSVPPTPPPVSAGEVKVGVDAQSTLPGEAMVRISVLPDTAEVASAANAIEVQLGGQTKYTTYTGSPVMEVAFNGLPAGTQTGVVKVPAEDTVVVPAMQVFTVNVLAEPTPTPEPSPTEPAPEPTALPPTPEPTAVPPTPIPTVVATQPPQPTAPAAGPVVIGELGFVGAPDNVDRAIVDVARGGFINTLGMGTEAWLAEPGKLLVGPDFPQAQIDAAGGAIERFNPLNQDGCRNNPPCILMAPGGGFSFASLGWGVMEMEATFGHVTLNLPGEEGHNYHVYIRGLYGDGRPDTDENRDVLLTAYSPGHVEVTYYPGIPNGGFVSEEQFEQRVVTSQSGGTNCGDRGCTKLTVVFFDLNTGALLVIRQDAPGSAWRVVQSNF